MNRKSIRAASALATLAASGAVLGGGSPVLGQSQQDGATIRTATTGNDSELVETIPIGRSLAARKRVVMSLEPGAIGALADGDRLAATAEVEVSVCLKPNELHGSDRPCIGRTYGYDPAVRAELVLADGGETTGGQGAVSLGKQRLTCTQSQPNRNHHCVIVVNGDGLDVVDASALPCNAETCHLNLVLSAADNNAKGSDKLVVGADADGSRVNGDKGRVNLVRYRGEPRGLGEALAGERPVSSRIPIAAEGGEPDDRVIYSVAVPDLKLGEQLVIDAKLVSRISKYPYNAFQASAVVLSEGRRSTSREGWPERVGDLNGQIAESNGFNCTQGSSGHSDPCAANKVGVLEITRDSPKTLYVNLTAGMAAQADFDDRHGSGDAARVLDKGYLRVYRYGAESNDSPPPPRD